MGIARHHQLVCTIATYADVWPFFNDFHRVRHRQRRVLVGEHPRCPRAILVTIDQHILLLAGRIRISKRVRCGGIYDAIFRHKVVRAFAASGCHNHPLTGDEILPQLRCCRDFFCIFHGCHPLFVPHVLCVYALVMLLCIVTDVVCTCHQAPPCFEQVNDNLHKAVRTKQAYR